MCTENISRSGLLVAWHGDAASVPLPSIGQILTVEVELPANHGFGKKCIHCQGVVSRISENGSDGPRIALSVNYMDFRSFHDRIRAVEVMMPEATSWMA